MNLTTFTSVFIFGIFTGVNNFIDAEKINNNLRHKTIVTGTFIKIKDILMNECEHLLNHGFTFRIVITFLSFYILLLFINKKGVRKYIFLIIPIILLGVEGLDKLPPEKWNWNIINIFTL
jgi:hypothetical protein